MCLYKKYVSPQASANDRPETKHSLGFISGHVDHSIISSSYSTFGESEQYSGYFRSSREVKVGQLVLGHASSLQDILTQVNYNHEFGILCQIY